jgi:hypothetical protein
MREFTAWLAETKLSIIVQGNLWVIPLIQSIHYLALAVLIGSALMLVLRALGKAEKRETTADIVQRYMPRLWIAFCTMALTGTLLLIGEPDRSLRNEAFWLKMVLIVAALVSTGILARGLKTKDSGLADGVQSSPTKLALASFGLWCAVLVAGRWIAYIDVN